MIGRWLALLMALLLMPTAYAQTNPVTCTLQYNLPADIPVPTSQADNDTFQGFGTR
jgi:hypothetical protein